MTVDELEDRLGNVLLDALMRGLTTSECDEAIMEAQAVLRTITALDNGTPTTARQLN